MEYAVHHPQPPLAASIECFWRLSGDGREAAAEKILPDGCIELIVHLKDAFRRILPGGAAIQPRAFVVGPMRAPIVVAPGREVRTFGVRFRPSGAARFFGVPLDQLAGASPRLDDLWSGAGADLLEALDGRPDEEAWPRLERLLLSRLSCGTEGDRAVEAGVSLLLRTGGAMSVADLARFCEMSPRQLERRFRSSVGLSPRLLARIVRFQRVFRLLPEGRAGWSDLAIEAGYADQSHLIRDFQEFAGEPPRQLLQTMGEMSRRFTSQERLDDLFDA